MTQPQKEHRLTHGKFDDARAAMDAAPVKPQSDTVRLAGLAPKGGRRWRTFGCGFLAVVVLIACAADEPVAVCTGWLNVSVLPISRSVAVGETFTPSASIAGCAADLAGPFEVRWRSLQPAIASVDSVSGLVRGLARGAAAVSVEYSSPRILKSSGTISVLVQ